MYSCLSDDLSLHIYMHIFMHLYFSVICLILHATKFYGKKKPTKIFGRCWQRGKDFHVKSSS